jgi:hypothetical protein
LPYFLLNNNELQPMSMTLINDVIKIRFIISFYGTFKKGQDWPGERFSMVLIMCIVYGTASFARIGAN